MAEISLSKLFKSQIHRLPKIESVRITRSFKRVERMVNDMQRHGFSVEQMTMRLRVSEDSTVICKVMPNEEKIIMKKKSS